MPVTKLIVSPPSCPGMSQASAPYCGSTNKDMDGRGEPGHDEG